MRSERLCGAASEERLPAGPGVGDERGERRRCDRCGRAAAFLCLGLLLVLGLPVLSIPLDWALRTEGSCVMLLARFGFVPGLLLLAIGLVLLLTRSGPLRRRASVGRA